MSVAFRREDDDAHREPTFELPIPPGPNLVTSRGLALIEARVAELESAVSTTPDEEAVKPIRRDLRYWHTRLATAELAPAPPEGEAGIGSRVRYRLNGAERTAEIVGGDEADPPSGRIAFSSPLGRALMEAAEGDLVDFNGAEAAIEVLEVGDPPG